jgi:hypothetical protein
MVPHFFVVVKIHEYAAHHFDLHGGSSSCLHETSVIGRFPKMPDNEKAFSYKAGKIYAPENERERERGGGIKNRYAF